MKNKSHKDLCAHIARIEGQLAAARLALQENNCSKVAKTLMAASRSLDSVRATCVTTFLDERVYKGARTIDRGLLRDVQALIKA